MRVANCQPEDIGPAPVLRNESTMLTDSDAAATIVLPEATAESEDKPKASPVAPARRKHLAGLRILFTAATIAGLLGFNAWWYWRDTRPVADLRTIEGLIARQQFTQAEAALRERLRRAPHDGEIRMTLARALAARGDLLGCAKELHEVPFWWPKKAETLYREAQAYLMLNRAREAESALLAVIDSDPLHPPDPAVFHDASQELLKLYAMEDRWDDAHVILWKEYDRGSPEDRPMVLSMRMRCELERMAPTVSVELLKNYVAADPEDFEALRAMANAELSLGQGAEALRHMQACLKGRPDDPRVWRDYLTMLQSLGELDAFNEALARVPAAAEIEPEIWMFRGQSRERESDWPGAAENYRQALERNPNLLNAQYRLAIVEDRLGLREQSAAHRKRWQALRDAQTQLRQADAEYRLALAEASSPGAGPGPKLRAAVKRLASICETLGWSRVAEGWNRVAASL